MQRQIRELRDDISDAERKEAEQAKRRKAAVSCKSGCVAPVAIKLPFTGDRT